MMLVYPMLNLKIEFEENTINSLIVENQNLLFEMINDLNNQTEGLDGKFVLSEDNEPIEIRKYAELITGLVPFTMNKKDILTKLYADIQKKALAADMFEYTNRILSDIERYVCDLSDIYSNELECTSAADIVPLLKMFNLKFAEEGKSLCEKLLDYFEAATYYKGKRLFITVNLRSFIDDQKADLFFKGVAMRKINLLCIDSYAYDKLSYEKRVIIDRDLCII